MALTLREQSLIRLEVFPRRSEADKKHRSVSKTQASVSGRHSSVSRKQNSVSGKHSSVSRNWARRGVERRDRERNGACSRLPGFDVRVLMNICE